MHYFIYPTKDVSIYSKYPDYNYGLDEILEIRKEVGYTTASYWNSRTLIQFNTSSFSSTAISSASYFYLNLYAANPVELAADYTLEVYPVSQSWDQGTGFPAAVNVHKDGATWSKRTRTASWSASGSDFITSSVSVIFEISVFRMLTYIILLVE